MKYQWAHKTNCQGADGVQNNLNLELVAPCGINCAVCMRFLATKRGLNESLRMPICTGCRPRNKKCKFIRASCALLSQEKIRFCFECPQYPCRRLQTLNRRYMTKYDTNLIDNLNEMKKIGIEEWLKKEREKWRCPSCQGLVSLHNKKCYECGYQKDSRNKAKTQ